MLNSFYTNLVLLKSSTIRELSRRPNFNNKSFLKELFYDDQLHIMINIYFMFYIIDCKFQRYCLRII